MKIKIELKIRNEYASGVKEFDIDLSAEKDVCQEESFMDTFTYLTKLVEMAMK